MFSLVNAKMEIDNIYNAQFQLSGELWNKFIIDIIDLGSGEDYVECGVHCKLHSKGCDFFLTDLGQCLLGLYSQTDGYLIKDPNELMSYHNSSNSTSLTKKGQLTSTSQSGQMFQDIFIISKHYCTFV